MNYKNLKKCVLKVFNFVKKFEFLKNPRIFLKIRKIFFFFVLKCKQKEHNLNRILINLILGQKPSIKKICIIFLDSKEIMLNKIYD